MCFLTMCSQFTCFFISSPFQVTVLIYFWDDRDGPTFSGWWIGPKVGGDQVWSHADNRQVQPAGAVVWGPFSSLKFGGRNGRKNHGIRYMGNTKWDRTVFLFEGVVGFILNTSTTIILNAA